MANDLRLTTYRRLVETIVSLGIPTLTVRDFIRAKPEGDMCILRHDVEWGCGRSLAVARIEAELGVRATYYFHGQHRPRVFLPGEIAKFAALGHEVGYHHETLDQCRGDFDAARRLFIDNLAAFRRAGLTIDTVCSHGNPRVRKVGYKVNYDLFKRYPELLAEQGLLGESYMEGRPPEMFSSSDTGARITAFRLAKTVHIPGASVQGLIDTLAAGRDRRLHILTHPDYWSDGALRANALSLAGRLAHLATSTLKRLKRI
ncbi:MAG: hypothetical protein KF723_08990 [Rhizobiaceae bacterium]|nr:hypothetical protein [Rhizobiaceae bacterium]